MASWVFASLVSLHTRTPTRMVEGVLTAGIAPAAEPARPGLADIRWDADREIVERVALGNSDGDLLDVIREVEKVGLDCPLGWPDAFVDFIVAHHSSSAMNRVAAFDQQWRRTLAYRATDEAVRQVTKLVPLSVSTDRIGLTAMRAAALLDQCIEAGIPVPRSGLGRVVEVYPSASLSVWHLPSRGYKGAKNRSSLGDLVVGLLRQCPWLDLATFRPLLEHSDDALDALVAALSARAAALKRATTPTPWQLEKAQREGWIALPLCPVGDLIREEPESSSSQ